MDARRLGADVQLGADLAVRASGGDEAEDVALAGGEIDAVGGSRVAGRAQLDAAAPRQRADPLQQRPRAEGSRRGCGGGERFGGAMALPEGEGGLGLAPAGVRARGRDPERIGARDRAVPRGRVGRVCGARQLGRAQLRIEDQLGCGCAGWCRGDLPGDPLGQGRRPRPRLALARFVEPRARLLRELGLHAHADPVQACGVERELLPLGSRDAVHDLVSRGRRSSG